MPGITVEPTRHHGGQFHRPKSVHVLIGKTPGNAVQLVDTNIVAYHVGPGANALFVGIEFESIAARPGYEHRTDPLVNADPLTAYQLDLGRLVINWICRMHNIPQRGPPSRAEMTACRGRYNGLLNHSSLNGYFATDQESVPIAQWPAEFMALGGAGLGATAGAP